MAGVATRRRAERGPIAVADEDRAGIAAVARVLAEGGPDGLRLIAGDGSAVAVPEPLLRVVRQAMVAFVADLAVSVVPARKQLTTQEAADLLNVSRPYLIRLVDEGKIPHTMVGTHRRVRFDELMAFKRRDDAARVARLDELTRSSQEMGFYDDL